MKTITYSPGSSFFHLLHPITKFMLLLGLSVAAFIISSPILMVITTCAIMLIFICIHENPFKYHGMRATIITALSIGLIQVLFQQQGSETFRIAGLSITDYGLQRAVIIASRFLVIVCGSYLFILTTSPSDLSYSLMQMKLPYRYAFMIITSMRLVPILSNEGERVFQAQKQRGAVYTLHQPARSMLHITTFMGAVMYALVDCVNKLAISMESRSFGRYQTRTFQKDINFSIRDGVSIGVVIAIGFLFHYLSRRGIV